MNLFKIWLKMVQDEETDINTSEWLYQNLCQASKANLTSPSELQYSLFTCWLHLMMLWEFSCSLSSVRLARYGWSRLKSRDAISMNQYQSVWNLEMPFKCGEEGKVRWVRCLECSEWIGDGRSDNVWLKIFTFDTLDKLEVFPSIHPVPEYMMIHWNIIL